MAKLVATLDMVRTGDSYTAAITLHTADFLGCSASRQVGFCSVWRVVPLDFGQHKSSVHLLRQDR
jgi:hypothetical protein